MNELKKKIEKVKAAYSSNYGGNGVGPLRMISHDQIGKQF